MTVVNPLHHSPPNRFVVAAAAVSFVGYFVLLHLLIVDRRLPMLALGMVIAPWVAAIGSALLLPFASIAKRPLRTTVALSLLVVLIFVGSRHAADLAQRVDLVLYLENLGFLLALSALFAISLRPLHEPLVTRLARVARAGDMPPPVVRYTRRVTIAWAVFFAIASVVSTSLFVTQSRAVWSAFVNLSIGPLVIAMFALEYAIRVRVLRDVRHISMMASMQAFRRRT